jgi:pyruvate,water dikinase
MSAEPATRTDRFASPFDVPAPEGAEDWAEMYPYYLRFSEERRSYEEGKLWFFDSMHWPSPVYPFDAITAEGTQLALGEMNTRIFAVPPALGIDHRVLNGYLYLSPEPVRDPDEIGRRLEVFKQRAGFYYANWDDLYARWRAKVTAHIEALKAIEIPILPDGFDHETTVTEARGISTGSELVQAYSELIASQFKIWSYHCEFLNIGYGAYLTFFQSCQQWFPGIADDTVAKMVAGIEVLLFRPDEEVKKLARRAVELGVDDAVLSIPEADALLAALADTEAGRSWLEALDEAKDPWFHFSSGTGIGGHAERSWIDDLDPPFASMRGYIQRLRRGEDLERPTEHLREQRERLATEYRALLATDEDRAAFDDLLGLSRTVFPYIEDHNFYVEHWYFTIFYNKVREVGRELARGGFLPDAEDVFLLNHHEVAQAVYDLVASWCTGTPARGPGYWPPIVERRRSAYEALRQWRPEPALGPVPEVVTDALQVMLWGLTTDRLRGWLDSGTATGDELRGVPASPGVAEGPARVVLDAAHLDEVQPGEVLVCPITAPSWVPLTFNRIVAAVSDIGGTMSHAAIVSREYGLPAVVGTGTGTLRIRTGQRVRVDGDAGTVRILEP